MSLISRIGRRFREKPKSTNLKLPSLPTPREILEDIDSCQSNDSVISLATLIQKKGRSSLKDIDFLEDPSKTNPSHLSFLAPYQIHEQIAGEDSSASGKAGTVKRKGSGGPNLSGSVYKGSKKPLDVEQINSYNKLKQFLLLYEKSEELMDNLEPHFKRIESTLNTCNEEYLAKNKEDELKDDLDDDGRESNSEGNDVCSSPLM